MTPQFDDPAAARSWNAYVARIDAALARISKNVAADLRRELLSHLCEGYDAARGSEVERVRAAAAGLGAPEEFLRPVAGRTAGLAVPRFAPRALAALPLLIGYATLALFAAMAVLQPFFPDHVGLFAHRSGAFSFGIARDTTGATELLGRWIIPIALTATAAIWWSLGSLQRRLRRR